MKCWVNGKLTKDYRPLPFDLAVTQGFSAFEMTRSFKRVHFKLKEHLVRLKNSCKLLGIPLEYSVSQLERGCKELTESVRFEDDDEHRLMIVASPGVPQMYSPLCPTGPVLSIYDFPLRHTVAGTGKQFSGAEAVISRVHAIPDSCIPSAAKHRSRTHFHMAQTQAGGKWPIMTTSDGVVSECPGANIVMVFKQHIVPITHNCLPGISQQTVVELAEKLGFPVSPGRVALRDLLKADEIWITGTPFCVLPVTQIHGTKFVKPGPGRLYGEVMRAWSDLVGVDIPKQIQSWDQEGV